jgi:3-oxoacyl-[acyl-carrier protein] reductase
MDLGLTGARALIAGASAGLGAAVAEALAAEGVRVALAARRVDRLADVAATTGGLPVAVDLSEPAGPAAAVAATVEAFGGLDLLLVNSGGPPSGTFSELSEEDWQRAIDGTFWSAQRLLVAALPHLRESDRAAILVILSSSVREPIPALASSNFLRPGLAARAHERALLGGPQVQPVQQPDDDRDDDRGDDEAEDELSELGSAHDALLPLMLLNLRVVSVSAISVGRRSMLEAP